MKLFIAILGAATVLLLTAGSASPVPAGAWGLWMLDENGGNSLIDTSGNGRNGTIHDGHWTAAGVHGYALQFGDASGVPFSSPHPWATFPGAFPFHADGVGASHDASLSFWVKPFDNQHRTLFWTADTPGGPDANRYHIYSGGVWKGAPAGSAIVGVDYRAPSGAIDYLFEEPVPLGQWNHVALTRTGNTYRLYLNRVLAATVDGNGTALPDYATGWAIGRMDGGFFDTNFMFNGGVDEIGLYGRALTAAEVESLYDPAADTDPPETTITAPHPRSISNDDTPTFFFTGDDGGGSGVASFECKIDSIGYDPCVSPHTVTQLTEGPHTFRVRAIDHAGNIDPIPASWGVQVDTSPPSTSITGGPSGLTNDRTPTFSFTGDDDYTGIDHFECRIDGSWSYCESGGSFGSLADGAHTFYVRAVDRAGNEDPIPASRTWVIDATAPSTTITSHPADPSDDTTPAFGFLGDDGSGSGVAAFRCRIDSNPSVDCETGATFGPLDEGPHSFYVLAIDEAGNTDPSPASFRWVINLGPPTVTITSPTDAPGNVVSPGEPSVDVAWSATEAGSYSVRVGGTDCTTGTEVESGSYTSGEVTSGILATELAYGANTVRVCVTDAAANTGSSTVTIYRQVPTTLSYSGDTQVIDPAGPTLKATLADGQTACDVVGQAIRFYVDISGDGDFGDVGEYLGEATTAGGSNHSSTASMAAVLEPGIYLVRVEFLGTNECAASADTDGIVTIVTPNDAASGGGWYQIVSPTPVTGARKNVSFGFTTRWSDKDQAYRGQILIHDKQAWRLKGEITSYAKTSSSTPTGTASGTGKLFRWQEVAPSVYGYVLADESVSFKVTFTDSGSSKKGSSTKPDTFTVNWITDYVGGAVSPLVTGSSFQPLKGGNITIR